ncbi:MAG: tRNA pseudouridine(55) synthase TruB [Clostridia bacterium]|nr:tRNA pseudouridine(55) synthase TruB [Clostridia bacterium]
MNGILIINKPKGYTSHDVVSKIKKILNIKKVGHTGTLDPNATGVLPLLLNEGTKLSKYLIEHDKEYEVTLKLGIKTDTADAEGKIIEEKQVGELANIENTLKLFIGEQHQIPPMYSAIKINGKKLYEYARKRGKYRNKAKKNNNI